MCFESRHDGQEVIFGIVVTATGSVLTAVMYVVCEHLLSLPGKLPPASLSVFVGLVGTLVMTIYVVVWDVPHLGTYFIDPVTKTGANVGIIAVLYAVAILANFVHQLAFYRICTGNAVSAGVNKAVQSVGVFFLSAALFCHQTQAECLTLLKGVAAVVVASGVVAYNVFAAPSSADSEVDGLEVSLSQPSPEMQ